MLSHATHLYFDHPNEPDVNEIGLSWATPFTDDIKVFNYKPNKEYDRYIIDGKFKETKIQTQLLIKHVSPVKQILFCLNIHLFD